MAGPIGIRLRTCPVGSGDTHSNTRRPLSCRSYSRTYSFWNAGRHQTPWSAIHVKVHRVADHDATDRFRHQHQRCAVHQAKPRPMPRSARRACAPEIRSGGRASTLGIHHLGGDRGAGVDPASWNFEHVDDRSRPRQPRVEGRIGIVEERRRPCRVGAASSRYGEIVASRLRAARQRVGQRRHRWVRDIVPFRTTYCTRRARSAASGSRQAPRGQVDLVFVEAASRQARADGRGAAAMARPASRRRARVRRLSSEPSLARSDSSRLSRDCVSCTE